MKTILKILYVVLIGVIAAILYFGMQSSFVSQNYVNLLTEASNKAATEKNYDDVARCFSLFSTPIDKKKAYFVSQGDENVTSVYSSVNTFTSTYLVDGKSKTETRIEKVYLIIIYNPTFQFENSADGTNKSALRFIGEDEGGNTVNYDYHFTVSSTINKDEFDANPTTEKAGSLHAERKHISDYRDYNLIFVPMPESLLGYIKSEVKMTKVTKLNIVENTGNVIYKDADYSAENGPLDYSQQFFTDLQTWIENIRLYTRYSNGEEFDQETIDSVTTYVNQFTENPNQYVANFDELYMRGIAHGQVFTGAPVIFKSLGIVGLFVIVGVLLYIVLFHLNWIKSFIRRFSKKAEPQRETPNRAPKTQTVISKGGVKTESKKPVVDIIEEKPEVLENKEEVKENLEAKEAKEDEGVTKE